ncbi:MAG: phosphatase PAP2 family protein [Candidatus Magasanikbacteria bacterium]|nr:phosphatase PAP2 family protein [Candidatus Magasanikbacteria bacterium]
MLEFLRGWDHQLTLGFNHFFATHGWSVPLAVGAADYLIFVLALVAVLVIMYRTGSKMARVEALLNLIASVFATYAAKWVIGKLWFRARPFVVFHAIKELIAEPITSHSFPSGHATVAAALAAVVYIYDKKWGRFAWVLAILVALGRVAAGVHYFSDVAVGLALGWLGTWIIVRFFKSVF